LFDRVLPVGGGGGPNGRRRGLEAATSGERGAAELGAGAEPLSSWR